MRLRLSSSADAMPELHVPDFGWKRAAKGMQDFAAPKAKRPRVSAGAFDVSGRW